MSHANKIVEKANAIIGKAAVKAELVKEAVAAATPKPAAPVVQPPVMPVRK